MIDFQAVTIESIDFSAQMENEVYENLRILYTTPEGSVPFDRQFGINTEFLDQPLQVAQGRLTVEYIDKTKRYEPRASIDEITFISDQSTGLLIPKVVISIDLEVE